MSSNSSQAPPNGTPGPFDGPQWPYLPGPTEHICGEGCADGHSGRLCPGSEQAGHCGVQLLQEAPLPTESHPGEPGRG